MKYLKFIRFIFFLLLFALASCEEPIESPALGSISGLVLDANTDLPIVGAEVRALVNDVADTTDVMGAFFLDSLVLGSDSLRVIVDTDTHYTAIMVVEGPQETAVRLDADAPELQSFRTFHYSRDFFRDVLWTQPVVFDNSDEQDTFIDSSRGSPLYFPSYDFYDDSIMVGAIYGDAISLIETFQIDSITVTPYSSIMTVHASLFSLVGNINYYKTPSHFVVLPRIGIDSIKIEMTRSNEQIAGDILPIRTYAHGEVTLGYDPTDYSMIVLRSHQDELAFFGAGGSFNQPVFAYGDSMLVGVMTPYEYTTPAIYIIAVVNDQNALFVRALTAELGGALPSPGYDVHFVAIPSFVSITDSLEVRRVSISQPQIE